MGLIADRHPAFRGQTPDEMYCVEAIGQRLSESMPSVARHAVGLHMAHTIAERLGRERLLATLGDPFAFALAFAETGTPAETLSKGSVELLMRWWKRYTDQSAPTQRTPRLPR